jgi:hypothetical protein
MEMPGGKIPLSSEKVYGDVPPSAVNAKLFGEATVVEKVGPWVTESATRCSGS